jgi:very-short-patch-repair endonuclease
VRRVWKTRGVRYHAYATCPGILEGQAKARHEGKPTYEPELVPLADVRHAAGPTPCLRCWPEQPGWHGWLQAELLAENHSGSRSGSPTELAFLTNVLEQVPELDPAYVKVQYEVARRVGRPFAADFAIIMPGATPLLLEVDGRNKGPDQREDHIELSLERDEELRELGYEVQHFTNQQVITIPVWRRDVIIRRIATLNQPPSPPGVTAPHLGASTRDQQSSVHGNFHKVEAEDRRSRPTVLIALTVLTVAVIIAGVVFVIARQTTPRAAPGVDGSCDGHHQVKGNVSQGGDLIYHEPGDAFYERTTAEVCFHTASDAEDAGYRRTLR